MDMASKLRGVQKTRPLSPLLILCLLTGGTSGQEPESLNFSLVGSIQLEKEHNSTSSPPPTSDLYIAGNYAYVGTFIIPNNRLHIVDISDPQNMRLAASVPIEGRALDVKVSGDLAVVAGDLGLGGEVTLIDVSDPENPEILSRFTQSCGEGVHNLFLYENRAYLAHQLCPGLTILDLSDPRNPAISGTWLNETAGFSNTIHDVFIRDGLAFLSDYRSGLVILDLSDPDHPATLSSFPIKEGVHSAWMENGYVYCNQEFAPETPMHILDISDPRHPVEVGSFRAGPPVSDSRFGAHNPWIQDGLLYWAYFDSGLRVFDLFDPANPVEIGYYFAGNFWGAQPHSDGLVYGSDNALSGLRAFRFEQPSHAIRRVELSQKFAFLGRETAITVTASTAPRGVSGHINRVSARFIGEETWRNGYWWTTLLERRPVELACSPDVLRSPRVYQTAGTF